eukprot:TRINITY_DN3230_c0_g1_i6.p1 TRINITY_DN3230_c0_g1~~TRINITY_DN3230_c0_g1_i6.p1  ORF type:complete len:215 (-),score=15.98 TRINITY_DN3230_c0_g1_i6:73-717(-)
MGDIDNFAPTSTIQHSLNDTQDELIGMTNRDLFSQNDYTVSPPSVRFLWIFPQKLELALSSFDNPIISLCQKPKGKFWFGLSFLLTAIVAIELLVLFPIILFILGFDLLATKVLYLSILIVTFSQIPKRFIWRYRPFMAKRADERQRNKTSSFPSRAVMCSVVFCYVIIYGYLYFMQSGDITWWMYLMFFTVPCLVSFARVCTTHNSDIKNMLW